MPIRERRTGGQRDDCGSNDEPEHPKLQTGKVNRALSAELTLIVTAEG
jgi:hypothetical protein